mmetsp:Transcript_32597/g.75011  ORF Transcript_32597/g.75011 Transcript_32597/m.75011 type:complete len:426 (-) Transcript_32597:131-1408(-)|eukprot:CAMPEP_0113319496 /NCGR_PEP_ID=MMETSP0010_2-20120614/13665_1 /TAXON_ID=216773 ORGANISM="Corethron hystrix, Strain 308" /NCGR_SAMPLE_ID=MMETSP0010_2 /ASSEMBLY_ACC=CAM_ASM_000155 /LENGTH=425 /DNA_ID=CAMNT_0000177057 /DNA_START=247 /DNA_END=1524 /DNA_ORIENTATION=- /assembly_acc=CAM_ASM_000155
MGKGAGSGGRASVKDTKPADGVWKSPYNPLAKDAPKLPTKGQIKAAIPAHCFNRSGLHSMLYVARDYAMVAALYFVTSSVLNTSIPDAGLFSVDGAIWFVGWNIYAFWQGTILTGPWVLAHECGHGAFSPSQSFNDFMGYIMHTALLVPYFSWQYTHAKHHRRTNNLIDGESHVPTTGKENGLSDNGARESFYAAWHEIMGDDAFAVFQIFTHLVVGWPLYLMGLASTGRLNYDGSKAEGIIDHYRPQSMMFPPKWRFKIFMSTSGVLGVLGLLGKAVMEFGLLPVLLVYGGPYMWTNAWLVLYTWLQHSDPSVPQYGEDEWTWVKGALSTIDRPYGIFCFFHHKIGSTHVAHHLFHEMPFYKADEATAALKEYLGPLYNYDPTPWYKAMWRVAMTCHYVEDTNGVQYYKSFNDVPRTKKKAKVS